jgi:hypothetical protein
MRRVLRTARFQELLSCCVILETVSGASAASSCIGKDVEYWRAREEVRASPRVCRWAGRALAWCGSVHAHQCSSLCVMCCAVVDHRTWPALLSLFPHVVAILDVRLCSAQTAHMGDKVVGENEWLELDN